MGDRLVAGRAVIQPYLLGGCFIIAVLTVVGMPPLSGFVGKVWILKTTLNAQQAWLFWPVYLFASFVLLVALSRAGTTMFWERKDKKNENTDGENAHPLQVIIIVSLLACSPLMVIFGGPITDYMLGAAAQLHDISGGINAVIRGGA